MLDIAIDAIEEAYEHKVIAFDPAPWVQYAACAGMDVDLFFPERGEGADKAKAVCAGCIVRTQCLDHALTVPERFGIFGGMSARERKRIRVARLHRMPAAVSA